MACAHIMHNKSGHSSLTKEGTDLPGHYFLIGLTLILVVALMFRAIEMNAQPFWMDEAFTYYVAKSSVHNIIFGQVDNHPPLFYLVQHFWQKVMPAQDWMRIPAMMAGMATIAVAGLMGADLLGRIAGLATALMVSLSASLIYFSLDARMYTLLALGAALATWGLIGVVQGRGRIYFLLYVAGSVLAIYSQFISLIYLLGLNLAGAAAMALGPHTMRRLVQLLAVNLLLLLLVLPVFVLAASAAGTFPGLGKTDLSTIPWFFKNTLGFPGIFGPFGLLLAALAFGFFLYSALLLWRNSKTLCIVLIGTMAFYPVALISVDQLLVPIFANRVLIVLIVPYALVLGFGFAALRSDRLKVAALVTVLLAGGFSAVMIRAHAPKVEDIPEALSVARQSGFSRTPIATCDVFTSASASLYSGKRPILWITEDGTVVRFDPRIIGNLPIEEIRSAKPTSLVRKLENANIAWRGDSLLENSRQVVALESVCSISKKLESAGFRRIRLQKLHTGPVVMESIWSKVSLWERPI